MDADCENGRKVWCTVCCSAKLLSPSSFSWHYDLQLLLQTIRHITRGTSGPSYHLRQAQWLRTSPFHAPPISPSSSLSNSQQGWGSLEEWVRFHHPTLPGSTHALVESSEIFALRQGWQWYQTPAPPVPPDHINDHITPLTAVRKQRCEGGNGEAFAHKAERKEESGGGGPCSWDL